MTITKNRYNFTNDPKMLFLSEALNPNFMTNALANALKIENLRLSSIKVKRYKPKRRCLIAYTFRSESNSESLTVLGKARARSLDKHSYNLQQKLYSSGFDRSSKDGIFVPKPLGLIPKLHMWLQEQVKGCPISQLITKPSSITLLQKVTKAIQKLHETNIPTDREHSMADELAILDDSFNKVAKIHPAWTLRLKQLMKACECLTNSISPMAFKGIHRDFYHDQLLSDGSGLYLLDLDLYTKGDPALDVGNFVGHLTELAVRMGDAHVLNNQEIAMENAYAELAGEESRSRVQVYKILTLARHIYISILFPERKAFTEDLLELCERNLNRDFI